MDASLWNGLTSHTGIGVDVIEACRETGRRGGWEGGEDERSETDRGSWNTCQLSSSSL